MDKQRFIQLIMNYYNGVIKQDELYELIYSYCIDKGKDSKASEIFVNFITSFSGSFPIISNIVNIIKKDWGIKYDIIEVFEVLPNGKTKLIKIY